MKYRNYLLTVLLVILAFNYVDRWALGMVLENIKTDLHLSDSQLGFMSGIAFALFYAVMGIPIARWADRGNRVTIVALTITVWSVMVALCGVAMNFVQLMLIRIGVGVGEAGCVPPAHSLIADYFTRTERPRAMSIYAQGNTLSVVIGYFLAGWLNELYGWRAMFILLSLPGLALAVLVRFTLREPRLGTLPTGLTQPFEGNASPVTSRQEFRLTDVFIVLWRNASYRHLLIGFSLLSFSSYGINTWQPAYFARDFGLTSADLGIWLAAIVGVSTMVAFYLGGELAQRHAPNDERLQLKAMAILNVAFSGVLWNFIYLAPNYYLAFALMAVANLGSTAIYGPLYAMLQTLVPPRLRATAYAIVFLFANLIGFGLGPLSVGALSDALRPIVGEESLRYALIAMCPGAFWASWHLWKASQTITCDLAALRSTEECAVSKEEPLAIG